MREIKGKNALMSLMLGDKPINKYNLYRINLNKG